MRRIFRLFRQRSWGIPNSTCRFGVGRGRPIGDRCQWNGRGRMRNPGPRDSDSPSSTRIIGHAPALLRAIEQVPLVAGSEAAVLISGETGTGKELVASAIHSMSTRAAGPFVTVNCGSLADN